VQRANGDNWEFTFCARVHTGVTNARRTLSATHKAFFLNEERKPALNPFFDGGAL